jgi:hypothetical protein
MGARLPTLADFHAMRPAERVAALAELDALATQLAELRGALRALLLDPPPPAALLDAKEVARRLHMSPDWVREHGGALGIEVWLTTDPDRPVVRYDPVAVEALRQRRRSEPTASPLTARLGGRLK